MILFDIVLTFKYYSTSDMLSALTIYQNNRCKSDCLAVALLPLSKIAICPIKSLGTYRSTLLEVELTQFEKYLGEL
jgi:hypothetical protein